MKNGMISLVDTGNKTDFDVIAGVIDSWDIQLEERQRRCHFSGRYALPFQGSGKRASRSDCWDRNNTMSNFFIETPEDGISL
jgi:hypothetical protein